MSGGAKPPSAGALGMEQSDLDLVWIRSDWTQTEHIQVEKAYAPVLQLIDFKESIFKAEHLYPAHCIAAHCCSQSQRCQSPSIRCHRVALWLTQTPLSLVVLFCSSFTSLLLLVCPIDPLILCRCTRPQINFRQREDSTAARSGEETTCGRRQGGMQDGTEEQEYMAGSKTITLLWF